MCGAFVFERDKWWCGKILGGKRQKIQQCVWELSRLHSRQLRVISVCFFPVLQYYQWLHSSGCRVSVCIRLELSIYLNLFSNFPLMKNFIAEKNCASDSDLKQPLSSVLGCNWFFYARVFIMDSVVKAKVAMVHLLMYLLRVFEIVKYNLQGVWGGRDMRFKKRAQPIYHLPL